jgi:methylmalonyl-CoA mutase C-terminal domain/subunit
VMAALRDVGLHDVLVFGGGVIPAADVTVLEDAGVARVFTPGAGLGEISRWLAETLDERESALRK